MKTRTFRVYGAEGHRQRVSFGPSLEYTTYSGDHIVERNSDLTGTNDFTEMVITANSDRDCVKALFGQIYDGAFENARTGKIVEVIDGIEAFVIDEWVVDGVTEESKLPITEF